MQHYMEFQTDPFIKSTVVDGSNSINHNQVQLLSYRENFLLSTCCWDWTCKPVILRRIWKYETSEDFTKKHVDKNFISEL